MEDIFFQWNLFEIFFLDEKMFKKDFVNEKFWKWIFQCKILKMIFSMKNVENGIFNEKFWKRFFQWKKEVINEMYQLKKLKLHFSANMISFICDSDKNLGTYVPTVLKALNETNQMKQIQNLPMGQTSCFL